MKKKINSATAVATQYGTWLLDRDGNLTPVTLHVPSTTWVGRGLDYLAPTDGEFLFVHNKIDQNELAAIVLTNFLRYLEEYNIEEYSITDITAFSSYAELKYAPTARQLMMSFMMGTRKSIQNMLLDYPSFSALNNKWYKYLQNNYVKVSKFNNALEFRISSDNYDWNEEIIDDVLLNESYDFSRCRITIMKETPDGYRTYFENATLNDVLSNDSAVLASTQLKCRKIIDGRLQYDIKQ